jgi:thiamine transporter
MRSSTTKIWVEGTILAALAMVLSFIPLDIGSSFSISLGQIPIAVYALRRGPKAGLLAAFIWGILHFPAAKVYFLSVIQVLIEYPIAFTFAGLTGLAATKLQKAIAAGDTIAARKQIVSGVFIGALARYFWHFVAGWVFWGMYALWGMSPVVFSLVMNGISGLATALVTTIVLLVLYRMNPTIFVPKDTLR